MKNTAPIPKIIYGTAWKKERTSELVSQAIKCGFRGIDTACQPKHYNEPGVGEAIQKSLQAGISRDELYIQTKFTPLNGQDPFNIPYDKSAALQDQIFQSFEVSKKNLGVEYLDGWVLHSPLESLDRTLLAWQAMEAIFNQGGVKRLGISNCYDLKTLQQLYKSASVKPEILQNRFYQDTDYDKDIRLWCIEKSITYQSFWTLTANPHLLLSKLIVEAAQTYQKTPAQILFKALMDLKIVPLTGTTSKNHMLEDLEAVRIELPNGFTQEVAKFL